MSTSLYHLNKKYLHLMQEIIDEDTGEIIGEALDIKQLNEIQDAIEVKVENIAVLIKN